MIKNKSVYQTQIKQYHEHCCVPECTASSTYNGTLSFHSFPSDESLRRLWLVKVCCERYQVTSHSKVCSLHFTPHNLSEATSEGGKRRLTKGAVPLLFKWNNFEVPPSRLIVCGTGWKDSRSWSPLCRLQNSWSALLSQTTTTALSLNLQAWTWQRLKTRNSKKRSSCYTES